jgi:ferredoxin
MKKKFSVSFPETDYQMIILDQSQKLSEYLTVQNSPVLFGCRTGICGTCLVIIEGDVLPPSDEEREVLEIFAPGNSQARLACQVKLMGDVQITAFGEG